MDINLRCNSLKCRIPLDERAVVTTCSHLFCIPCAESLGLANPSGDARICPACQTHLLNPDDAVVTQLNPTEDYKTSVLSGLSPTVIMECAGRGLAFWAYQSSQEIVYQEYLAKSLADKYSTLSGQMDKVILEANAEITGNREKMSEKDNHIRSLERKNADLVFAFRDKAKSLQQMKKLYQSLKQQQVAAGMELAADNDAEHVLRAASQHPGAEHNRTGSNGSGEGRHKTNLNAWETGDLSQSHERDLRNAGIRRSTSHAYDGQWPGSRGRVQTSRNLPVPPTPSNHRTRLPTPQLGKFNPTGVSEFRHGTPSRPVLNTLDPNSYNGNGGGYGASGGVRVGKQHGNLAGYVRPDSSSQRTYGPGGLNVRR